MLNKQADYPIRADRCLFWSLKIQGKRIIPFILQISALAYGGAGVFGKGFDSMDAIIEPTWTYLRRPLTGTPAPKFD
ncbi:MAG TPA: hypothetical protein DCZ48_15495 [Methylococcaceae bacterium]|nr:hypothetical protein [Methylococcaceae bacterium]